MVVLYRNTFQKASILGWTKFEYVYDTSVKAIAHNMILKRGGVTFRNFYTENRDIGEIVKEHRFYALWHTHPTPSFEMYSSETEICRKVFTTVGSKHTASYLKNLVIVNFMYKFCLLSIALVQYLKKMTITAIGWVGNVDNF